MIDSPNFFLEANQLKFAITTQQFGVSDWAVSYTHLTLPTILLV